MLNFDANVDTDTNVDVMGDEHLEVIVGNSMFDARGHGLISAGVHKTQ